MSPLRQLRIPALGWSVLGLLWLGGLAGWGASPPAFPLRVSADHRYLEDSSGRPFLVAGDTAWSLIAQLDESDAVRYLDDRVRRGFTATIVNLIEHKFASKAPALRNGTLPFLAPGDFERPNPAYFDFAHRVLGQARQRGIAVWLCPAYLGWGGGDEGFFKEIQAAGPEALRRYGRYLGERFRDLPNLIWVLGGDYALKPAVRWTANDLALGLRDGGASQLMTAHGGQTTALGTFGEPAWLAVDTVYSYATNLYEPLLTQYERRLGRPFVLMNPAREVEVDPSARGRRTLKTPGDNGTGANDWLLAFAPKGRG